jgi:nitrite transporter NirC
MYRATIEALAEQAAKKLEAQQRSLLGHFVRSMLAGMYVGISIALIFTIGGTLSVGAPFAVRFVMGACFGCALNYVVFAGAELFTGSNLVLTLGVLARKARLGDLVQNWVWTWLGNLAGSILLAWMVVQTGLFDNSGATQSVYNFVQNVVAAKMNLPPMQLFWRAVLANWLVCLGVWMAARIQNEAARLLMIWWCMFTFITCGFEHSIANMFGLLLGLFVPHSESISWVGYWYNLGLATLGNIVGGAVFVAGMYWLGTPEARDAAQPVAESNFASAAELATSRS